MASHYYLWRRNNVHYQKRGLGDPILLVHNLYPGASHEDRTKPKPDPTVKDADAPDQINKHSEVSGGGGEADIHHAHHPDRKRDFESPSEVKGENKPN